MDTVGVATNDYFGYHYDPGHRAQRDLFKFSNQKSNFAVTNKHMGLLLDKLMINCSFCTYQFTLKYFQHQLQYLMSNTNCILFEWFTTFTLITNRYVFE